MAINLQVSCIKHVGGRDQHGHIVGIGGYYNGKSFYYTETAAIQEIKKGTLAFYTAVNGNSAWVIIETRNGHEFLKTQADHSKLDNLLSLPPCQG